MEFIERLKSVINYTGLQNADFANKCGISKSQIQKYLNGSQEPKMIFFGNLKKHFPQINIDWLIVGEGEMIVESQSDINTTGNSSTDIVEIEHTKLVKRFKNKELAKKINEQLIELEEIDERLLQSVATHVSTKLDTAKILTEPETSKQDGRMGGKVRKKA